MKVLKDNQTKEEGLPWIPHGSPQSRLYLQGFFYIRIDRTLQIFMLSNLHVS